MMEEVNGKLILTQEEIDIFIPNPRKMQPNDPAYWMLFDGVTTTPVVHSNTCYICNNPEFAQMGLPLCRKCPECKGHIAADDSVCDDCGFDEIPIEGEYEVIDQ